MKGANVSTEIKLVKRFCVTLVIKVFLLLRNTRQVHMADTKVANIFFLGKITCTQLHAHHHTMFFYHEHHVWKLIFRARIKNWHLVPSNSAVRMALVWIVLQCRGVFTHTCSSLPTIQRVPAPYCSKSASHAYRFVFLSEKQNGRWEPGKRVSCATRESAAGCHHWAKRKGQLLVM